MTDVIMTLADLEWAQANNFEMVQHYEQQVTLVDDFALYLKYLNDKELTTECLVTLRREKKRDKGIHPSSACKKKVCLAKIYYECTFEIEPFRAYDQQMQMTWDIGTMLHDLHQLWLEEMFGDQFEKEVALKRGIIKSHTDGLFTFTNFRKILELKSIKEGGNFGWDTVQHKPMEDHVRQAHFYMWLADVPFALIFYMGKNNSEYIEHAVTFNPLLWEEMENNVILPVQEAVKRKEIPDFNPSWSCRWCDFEHSCPKKGGDDEPDWT